ncbi:MAG: energy-coupling factor transporter transmembrane protein EcfT [Sphaerochaetaceae bacterium]|nr:energy-coupling factor transporter transmembrane protein EcfT [Sphaerochaetaceae bacterium]
MNRIAFGKYIPTDSPLHRLDPRAKLAALVLLVVSVFVPVSWYCYIPLALTAFLAVRLSYLKLRFVARTLRPILFLMLFLFVVNALTLKRGEVIYEIGSFQLYSYAISFTLRIGARLFLMIVFTTCLTATTKPLDLNLAIEYILRPLGLLRFPVHEVAMMISIALRFIPTLSMEAGRIMNAQKSRGVDFEDGKLLEKASAILSLAIPLFTIAFERAYELADAMEARGYVPGERRTRYRKLRYCSGDLVLVLFSLLMLAAMILSRVLL